MIAHGHILKRRLSIDSSVKTFTDVADGAEVMVMSIINRGDIALILYMSPRVNTRSMVISQSNHRIASKENYT